MTVLTVFRLVLAYILRLYSLILLGRVLASWADPDMRTPVSQLLFRLTEPVLAPVRRALPQSGPVDLSSLIVFLILTVLAQFIDPL